MASTAKISKCQMAKSNIVGMAVNTINRPIVPDVLARQPVLKRNSQLGLPTKPGIQIDERLLINKFLGFVPLTGLGLMGDKLGPVRSKDLLGKHEVIYQKTQFLFGRWVVILLICPDATPDRNFLTLFDAETYELLDCVEIVCNNKYCVYNFITRHEFADGGYLGLKLCAHIDMNAMSADKEYSDWFLAQGFPLDNNDGLYSHRRVRSRGKDHSTPPPRPTKNIKTRWDAMVFYINPDYKFRQFGLPRWELPYAIFEHGNIEINVLTPSTGLAHSKKVVVDIYSYGSSQDTADPYADDDGKHQLCRGTIIYDHNPFDEIPYPFLNDGTIDLGGECISKTNGKYFATYERIRQEDAHSQYGYKYSGFIKSFDITQLRRGVIHEISFTEKAFTSRSEKYILLPDGRIEMPADLSQKHKDLVRLNEYIQLDYVDSQGSGSELVIYKFGYVNELGETEFGYKLQIVGGLMNYAISAGNIYKLAVAKSLMKTDGVFKTADLESQGIDKIIYSPDGRYLAMIFKTDYYGYREYMVGVLLFEKPKPTSSNREWREIGYVSLQDLRLTDYGGFSAKFIGNCVGGYNLLISRNKKTMTDIVYLPDTLADKYYSRLTAPGVELGITNNILKQVSRFLAYDRLRYQELRESTSKKHLGKPMIQTGSKANSKPFREKGKIKINWGETANMAIDEPYNNGEADDVQLPGGQDWPINEWDWV